MCPETERRLLTLAERDPNDTTPQSFSPFRPGDGPGAQIKGECGFQVRTATPLIFCIAGLDDIGVDRRITATLNLHGRVVRRSPRRDMSQAFRTARESRSTLGHTDREAAQADIAGYDFE